jgi:TRAP-type uncharacterized transport system substrate-binding protein
LKNALGFVVSAFLAVASNSSVQAEDMRATRLNQGTIGLMASRPDLVPRALQIAKAIDHTDGLRILPIIGRGGIQTINDLQFLRGVDVAMISSDALAFVGKNGLYTDEAPRVSCLAKLGNSNVIVLARPEFNTLASLAGRKIAVGSSESDEFIAADLIFGGLGLHYEGVGISGETALAGMRNKSIDAMVFAGADAYPQLSQIDAKSNFHILPIAVNAELAKAYSPAILTSADFPDLIAADATVETVASALVLAVFDWPNRSERFYKLAKFNTALATHYFAALSPEKSTNFSAAVPGWKTYVTLTEPHKKVPSKTLPVTALQ